MGSVIYYNPIFLAVTTGQR